MFLKHTVILHCIYCKYMLREQKCFLKNIMSHHVFEECLLLWMFCTVSVYWDKACRIQCVK